MPGLEGTVVNINVGSGMWGRTAPTFDVLWSDMQCSRRISQASLEGGEGGQFEMLSRRTSAVECARLWHAYQVHRVRQMAERAAARQSEESAHAAPRRDLAAAPRMNPAEHMPQTHVGGREIASRARHRLAEQVPGVGFAVTCARSRLDVSWVDGPVEGFPWRVLADMREQDLVSEVRTRRSLSPRLIQCAIDFCLDRVFDGAPSSYARLRVTPEQYSAGGLSAVMAESGKPGPSISYQSLLRCVLARWDDARQKFVNTACTRALVQEMALLFPDGDEEAGGRFRRLAQEVAQREGAAHSLVERMRQG